MNPPSRILAVLRREPFAVAALLTFAALYLWYRLTVAEVVPLPNAVGPRAIETIAEVWCLSALPTLWLADRRRLGALGLVLAAIVPPMLIQLAIFAMGSTLLTEEDRARNLQLVQFVLGTTAVVGCVAALTLQLLRRGSRAHRSNA